MRKNTGAILILLLLTSCKSLWHAAPQRIKQGFTYKYDGKSTSIDSLININGYYTSPTRVTMMSIPYKNDTTYETKLLTTYFVFFKDGMCAKICQYARVNASVNETFQKIVHDDSMNIRNSFYEDCIWGRYLIFGNSIKLQLVERPIVGGQGTPWEIIESWYKIVDKNTIQEVGRYPISVNEDTRYLYYESPWYRREFLPTTFTPTAVQPSSSGWIKEEKWFWRNEEDWQKYMSGLKKEK